jgi:hypothetical protein
MAARIGSPVGLLRKSTPVRRSTVGDPGPLGEECAENAATETSYCGARATKILLGHPQEGHRRTRPTQRHPMFDCLGSTQSFNQITASRSLRCWEGRDTEISDHRNSRSSAAAAGEWTAAGAANRLRRSRESTAAKAANRNMVKRPLQTIDCSGRLTTATLPILTRSRPRLSGVRFPSDI